MKNKKVISVLVILVAIIAIIDKFVPNFENPHELRDVKEMDKDLDEVNKKKLMRMGLFSALAIAIHNFPEGLATFVSALEDPALGVSIAIAIAIHNIPEGIAVSVPIYYATGSRKKALWLSKKVFQIGPLQFFLKIIRFLILFFIMQKICNT